MAVDETGVPDGHSHIYVCDHHWVMSETLTDVVDGVRLCGVIGKDLNPCGFQVREMQFDEGLPDRPPSKFIVEDERNRRRFIPG